MSFKRIKGHDRQIEILKRSCAQDRLPCAYLFAGPEGIGKSFVAKEFAKSINCLDNKANDCCDRCPSCLKIDNGNHPDVHWIPYANIIDSPSPSGGDSIKIENIRQLQKEIYLKPFEARTKIFIINDAQVLTLEASNALLNILEEPPRNSLIILITSKTQLLLPTIISRCQKLKFFSLEKNLLEELLTKEHKLNKTLSHYLAYFYEGKLGKALNLKGVDIITNKNRIIDYFTSARSSFPDIGSDKDKIKEYFNILASWFRDIYFIKIGMPYVQLINGDRKNDLIDAMSRYSLAELDSIFSFISHAFLYLDQNVNPKLLLSNLRIVLNSNREKRIS